MSNNDYQDLLVEYEMLRQDITNIDAQLKELQEHHASLASARDSIRELKQKKTGDLFVPAGGGFYFNASVTNNSKILVSVGASVLVEMGFDRAEKTINDRVDQALSMIVKLNEDADAIMNRLRDIEGVLGQAQMVQ